MRKDAAKHSLASMANTFLRPIAITSVSHRLYQAVEVLLLSSCLDAFICQHPLTMEDQTTPFMFSKALPVSASGAVKLE